MLILLQGLFLAFSFTTLFCLITSLDLGILLPSLHFFLRFFYLIFLRQKIFQILFSILSFNYLFCFFPNLNLFLIFFLFLFFFCLSNFLLCHFNNIAKMLSVCNLNLIKVLKKQIFTCIHLFNFFKRFLYISH